MYFFFFFLLLSQEYFGYTITQIQSLNYSIENMALWLTLSLALNRNVSSQIGFLYRVSIVKYVVLELK